MGFKDTLRWLSPLVGVIEHYTKANAKMDIVAGLTVGVLLLPQAMAYAQLALLPPVYGLYTSVTPTIVFAMLGESHAMNLGTIALCGLLTADIVEQRISDPSSQMDEVIATSVMVAFLCGIFFFIVGIARVGEGLQSFLSPALVSGFHTGAAFHVMVSQLKYVMGVAHYTGPPGAFHVPRKLYWFASQIPNANGCTLLVGFSGMVMIYLCKSISRGTISFGKQYRFFVSLVPPTEAKRLMLPIPAEFVAVIVFEILSSTLKMAEKYGVAVIGKVESESIFLPVANLDWSLTESLIKENYAEMIVIAIITLSLTLSDSKTYAEETDRKVNADRELLALGFSNLIPPFFGAYIAGAGISRSATSMELDRGYGHLTQMYSLIAAVVVMIAIPFIGVIQDLPQAVLGAIALMALNGIGYILYL